MKNAKKHPVVDHAKCTGCDECLKVCPNNAVFKQPNYDCLKCVKYCHSYLQLNCKPEHYFICLEKCDACGMCIETCPTNAIYWVQNEALKTL